MDTARSPEQDADPVQAFAARLRQLQADSGGPSVRDLVRLTDKGGQPYTRGTIQDKLSGRSAAPWEFVQAFVGACGLHCGGTSDLRPWREWHAQMAREVAARRAGRRRTVDGQVCPYRGLETFTAEHAEWFHGRATAVQQVLAGLSSHRRGVLLLGPSGAGKSSLVQAGVLPALAAGQLPGSDRWIIVFARPGKDLLAELDRAGLPGAGGDPMAQVVARRLADEPSDRRLLVVVDQFEELLTPPGDDSEEAAQVGILDQLATVVGAPGVTLILILRDDFYPRLASQAPELLRALAGTVLNVPASLSVDELRDIITKPAEAVGLDYQDGLPERMVTDVLAADSRTGPARRVPTTVLPLLELTLQQLWLRRHGTRLTHDAYQRIGGITGALTTWCDAAVEQFTGAQRSIARRILTALVRPADEDHHIPAVRQQVPLAVLRELAGLTDPAGDPSARHSADEVLAVLTEHRIVATQTVRTGGPPDDSPGVPVAELVHDALIRDWAALRDWVDRDHRFQDWLRRAGERHSRWSALRSPDDLLHGSDLAEGLEWSTQRRLPATTAGFLAASRQYQRRRVRRARRLTSTLAVLLVVALCAAGLASWQRQAAVTAQQVAQSRQLAAQSAALFSADPELASLLAVQAYRTSRTAEATAAVYAAVALPLTNRLVGHTTTVRAIAYTPDGRTLATAGDDAPRLWDAATGRPRTVLTGHTGTVLAAAFSPDGRTLATGGADGTVRLWDAATGRPRTVLTGHTRDVFSVAFSPDGRTLASGSADTTVRLWDVATGRPRTTVTGHGHWVYSVAFSPDGRTVAASGAKGTISLWDTATGRPRATLAGHTSSVLSVAFSPDGRTVATGDKAAVVRLWDLDTRRPRATLTGHTSYVYSVAFSPDGRTLASGSEDTAVRLWDPATGQARRTLPGGVLSLTFSPNGRTLATGGVNGTVRLWDMISGQARSTLHGHTDSVTGVAFSPDGRTVASGSDDRTARLWDVATGRSRAVLTGHTDSVGSVAFHPDGRILATSGGDDHTIRLWDTATGRSRAVLTGHTGTVYAVALSPDGRTLASIGGEDHTTRLWEVSTGRTRATLTSADRIVSAVAFSGDGRTLATGGSEGVARLWDTATEKSHISFIGHTGFVLTIAFSRDGRTVATGGSEGTVRLWDTATGRPKAVLTGHTGRVLAVAFSPDGRTLASGSEDNTARLWDVASGQPRSTFTGHTRAVYAVAFSPDGRTLAIGNGDRTLQLWDVQLYTPAAAIAKICAAVNRDLTASERTLYLPAERSSAGTCPTHSQR